VRTHRLEGNRRLLSQLTLWIGFNVVVVGLLALDLFVFHRKAHEVSLKEAAGWTAFWIALALLFNAGVYAFAGPQKGLEFLTGYLIEKALSVDNIFVFVMVFAYFGIPAKYQHRVLFWGILGALVMRGAMIGAGAYLIHQFHWVIYVFGAFLVFTGIRMAFHRSRDIDPDSNPVIRLVRRLVPVTREYHGQRFFVRQEVESKKLGTGTTEVGKGGVGAGKTRLMATPLFVVLAFIETTDLLFALDSIPAVFAITEDPFIVYTSNVFAILGLRALYFLLAGVIDRFHYLQLGLSVVLVFVGAKMLLADIAPIPVGVSLGVIALVLAAAVGASLLWPRSGGGTESTPTEPGETDRREPPEAA
jgi:tellurite resistance protein TerC